MSDLSFAAFFVPTLLLACCMKALFWVYPRFQTPRARLAAQLGFLALFTLLYALLLAYFLAAFSLLAAYWPALLAGLTILFVQMFLILVQHFTRSKRTLTEHQKAELMDL